MTARVDAREVDLQMRHHLVQDDGARQDDVGAVGGESGHLAPLRERPPHQAPEQQMQQLGLRHLESEDGRPRSPCRAMAICASAVAVPPETTQHLGRRIGLDRAFLSARRTSRRNRRNSRFAHRIAVQMASRSG